MKTIATIAALCLLPAAAPARQAVPAATPAVVQAQALPVYTAGSQTMLPANTEVLVTLNDELNSKKAKSGQPFDVSVSRDVMLGNYIVIPRGTHGRGQVAFRTGKGAFGKSGKMEIEVKSLDLGGRTVALSGRFRQEGQGNTGATIGTAIAVGVFSAFVTGHSAVFEQGRELRTHTSEALPVALPIAPAGNATVAVVAPATPATAIPVGVPAK